MMPEPKKPRSLSPEEQRDLVLTHLARREGIEKDTRRALKARDEDTELDPLAGIDPRVREDAEAEFYAKRGRERYVTSDGRVLFLTEKEIDKRKQGRTKKRPRYAGYGYGYGYGSSASNDNQWTTWAFNVGVVAAALLLVYIILY